MSDRVLSLGMALVVLGLGFATWLTHTRTDPYTPTPYLQEGKMRGPGVMTQETLRAIELQTAKQIFSGPMRDPFVRLR